MPVPVALHRHHSRIASLVGMVKKDHCLNCAKEQAARVSSWIYRLGLSFLSRSGEIARHGFINCGSRILMQAV